MTKLPRLKFKMEKVEKISVYSIFFVSMVFLVACGASKKNVMTKTAAEESPNVILYEPASENINVYAPTIGINPKKPGDIILSSGEMNVHRSSNGGNTWTSARISTEFTANENPLVISDYRGIQHYFLLTEAEDHQSSNEECATKNILRKKSNSNGLMWSDAESVYQSYKTIYNLDAYCNKENNKIYLTWLEVENSEKSDAHCDVELRYSISDGKGNNWSEITTVTTIQRTCDDCAIKDMTPVITAGKKGEVIIAYQLGKGIYVLRSNDGGQSWKGGNKPAINLNTTVNDLSGSQLGIAFDESKKKKSSNLYLVFTDIDKSVESTYIAVSKDGGESFVKKPISMAGGINQLFPAISVDPADGQIYLIYYQKNQGEVHTYDISMAISQDGGEEFEHREISDESMQEVGSLDRNRRMSTIQALGGMVRPVWIHYNGTSSSLKTALINRTVIK